MKPERLYWFRTRQALLEEWGYTIGLWHLVRRSQLSIAIIGIDAAGQPRRDASGALSEHAHTRVPTTLLDLLGCEFRGPFACDDVPLPLPDEWEASRPASTWKRRDAA